MLDSLLYLLLLLLEEEEEEEEEKGVKSHPREPTRDVGSAMKGANLNV